MDNADKKKRISVTALLSSLKISSEESESQNASRSRSRSRSTGSEGSEDQNESTCSSHALNLSSDSANTSTASQSTTEQNSSAGTAISRLLNYRVRSSELPEKHVLYCFHKKFIPQCIKNRYTSELPSELTESSIYLWLKPSVIGDTQIEVSRSRDNEPRHYMVRMYAMSSSPQSEFFTALHFGEDLRIREQREKYLGSILIIPMKDPDCAMIYCFGKVTSLINKFAIVQHFGLKLTASKGICRNLCQIKELTVETPYDCNVKTKTTTASNLDTMAVFTPVAGTDYFHKMRLRPDGSKRLVKGSDRFEFDLKGPNKKAPPVSHAISSRELTRTLIQISQELYDIYTKNIIHVEYENYIAKEIDNVDTIRRLNKRLVAILKKDRDAYDDYFLSLNPVIFKWGLGTRLQYRADKVRNDGEKQINSGRFLDALHDTMRQPGANLESVINVTNDKNKTEREHVFALLIANVIEDEEKFCHFAFGRWFEIPTTRYEYIKKSMERKKEEYSNLGLIPYTRELHNAPTRTLGDLKIYKELRYNIAAVNKLSQEQESAIRGILIDRILIPWGRSDGKNKFEFADIFVADARRADPDELHYILHVKRRSSKDFEKLCNQVMRCAEFLSKILTKTLYTSLMLQGCINSLYAKHGRALVLSQVSHSNELTHGRTIKAEGTDWQMKVRTAIKRHAKDQTNFHRGMRNAADTFFVKYAILSEHRKECVAALNALFDCYETDRDNLTFVEAEIFFSIVERFVCVANRVLGTSKLNREVCKKTYIMAAFIDDSKSPLKIDGESGLPNYFTHNQLLGMELVQRKVEGMGFQFRWTWIENDFEVAKKSDTSENLAGSSGVGNTSR